MKNGLRILSLFFTILFLSLPAFCADAASDAALAEGKALLEKSCSSCHNDELFKKEMRKVSSMEKLEEMVGKCSKAANADWTEAQKKAVAQYLNANYYKF
jgi:mono/diheme cytochrome c family protein